MDADTLRERHRAAVTRYAPLLADTGRVPDGLLDALAAIASQHLRTERGADAWLPVGEPVHAQPVVIPAGEPLAKPPAARTPARRTRTRTAQP